MNAFRAFRDIFKSCLDNCGNQASRSRQISISQCHIQFASFSALLYENVRLSGLASRISLQCFVSHLCHPRHGTNRTMLSKIDQGWLSHTVDRLCRALIRSEMFPAEPFQLDGVAMHEIALEDQHRVVIQDNDDRVTLQCTLVNEG